MRNASIIIVIGILGLLGSCAGGKGGSEPASGFELEALHGTSAAQLQLAQQSGMAIVNISALGEQGVFFSLRLPGGQRPAQLQWFDTQGLDATQTLLTLSNFDEGRLTVGAVPTGGAVAADYRLQLSTEADNMLRLASATEDEIHEEPVQFAVMDFDPVSGSLLLSWPAWTPGDYDLSGIVGIQDITPLGKHYGADNGSGQPWPQEDPLHWVDGNTDGVLNASDLSVIGQHFNDELLGFRIYRNGQVYDNWDEFQLNLLQGDPQGAGLPRRHFLHLPGIADPQLLELRAVMKRHGSSSGGSNPDLEVHISIDGIELIDNGNGLKAGTRVIEPIEDVAGIRKTVAQPEHEDGQLASFRGIPRGRDFLLDINYLPASYPGGTVPLENPAVQNGDGSVNTAVPFRLPELHGRTVLSVDIHYEPQPDGSYSVELDSRIDYGNGVEEYSALLDYAGGLLRRDSNNDGSFSGELEFTDSDRDCISDNYSSELYGINNLPNGNLVHGVFDGPLESIDYAGSSITMSADAMQFWSDGVLRQERSVNFSETVLFVGFDDIRLLQPGDFLHVEMYRMEDGAGNAPAMSWAEFIHALDRNFGEYWISAELQQNSQFAAISVGRGGSALDGSYPQYVITVRDELTGDYFEQTFGEVNTGFVYLPLWPDHLYTISLLGVNESGAVLLADTQLYIDPEQFWDGFGDPPAGTPGGGPGI